MDKLCEHWMKKYEEKCLGPYWSSEELQKLLNKQFIEKQFTHITVNWIIPMQRELNFSSFFLLEKKWRFQDMPGSLILTKCFVLIETK